MHKDYFGDQIVLCWEFYFVNDNKKIDLTTF